MLAASERASYGTSDSYSKAFHEKTTMTIFEYIDYTTCTIEGHDGWLYDPSDFILVKLLKKKVILVCS